MKTLIYQLSAAICLLFSHPILASSAYFEEFIKAYQQYGNGKYMIQEEITQKEHVLQAAFFANLVGAPEDIVVALLFHDVGQISQAEHVGNVDYLHTHHDEIGGTWLKDKGFPRDVTDLVRYHTLMKIFLVEDEKDYYQNLSEASKISYQHQKKKYLKPEKKALVEQVKTHPRLEDYKAARRCDELAKIIMDKPLLQQKIPPMTAYREMAERVRQGQGQKAKDPHWRTHIKSMHHLLKTDRAAFEQLLKS